MEYKSTARFNERYKIDNYYSEDPSSLYKFSEKYIKDYLENVSSKQIKILDIGGGQGRDSIALAKLVPKSEVIMLDLSDEGMQFAENRFEKESLSNRARTFKQDIFQPYAKQLLNADIASACMSMMFHSDSREPDILLKETENVFKNAVDSLKLGGLLFFSVYSDFDHMFKKGEPMGGKEELRLMPDGRYRHFFTEEYINELLTPLNMEVLAIEAIEEEYDPQMEGRLFYMYNVAAKKIK